jgi:hypothetical protein
MSNLLQTVIPTAVTFRASRTTPGSSSASIQGMAWTAEVTCSRVPQT